MRSIPELRWSLLAVAIAALLPAARAAAGFVPRWTAESDFAGARYGTVVASAGDVNGDGLFDMLVGAPYAAGTQPEQGKVYLYLGTPSGPSATPSWIGTVNQGGALFGYAVTGAGDVNGDGYDDIAVGAPLWDGGQTDEGAVFIYYGSDTGLVSTPAMVLESNSVGALFGAALAGFGDVNFDGFNDLLVGAPQYTNGQTREGRVYVFQGSDTGLQSTPLWTLESNVAEAQFGHTVAFVDPNTDFDSDVAVGSPYMGSATSRDRGRADVYLSNGTTLANTPAWSVTGPTGSRFGSAISGADDFNGDGYNDVVVGAPGWTRFENWEGAARVYLGGASGLTAVPSWTFEGRRAETGFGSSVLLMSDANGDGFAETVIGAPGWDTERPNAGRIFIKYGTEGASTDGDESAPPMAEQIDGVEPGATLGSSIAELDLNNDLINELLAGSPAHTGGQRAEGGATWYTYSTIVTGVGSPSDHGLVIEAVRPNPVRLGIDVWFTLPAAGPAMLELLDIAGRRVASHDLATFGPGRHHVQLADARTLAPGLYLARLGQGRGVVNAKLAVIR